MKACTKCGLVKDLSDFAWKFKDRGVKASNCKACQKVMKDAHYQRTKQVYIDRAKRVQRDVREFIQAYKESNPCADCSEYFPYYVMDFDHLDASSKSGTVASLIKHGMSYRLWEEIDKCELVCSNCHRERTHTRGFGVVVTQESSKLLSPVQVG